LSEDYGSEILVEVQHDGKPFRFGVKAHRFGATLSLKQVMDALEDFRKRLVVWKQENGE